MVHVATCFVLISMQVVINVTCPTTYKYKYDISLQEYIFERREMHRDGSLIAIRIIVIAQKNTPIRKHQSKLPLEWKTHI